MNLKRNESAPRQTTIHSPAPAIGRTSFSSKVLIALNESPLPRDSICRLGARPELWLDAPEREDARLSRILSVSVGSLTKARQAAADAPAIANRATETARDLGARVVTRFDVDYPRSLLDLELPPPVLFLLGRVPEAPGIAMVGPRNADPYALEAASLLAGELASAGLAVVSGFARGVDIAAHRAVLDVPGGRTVAVLGCGLSARYPRQHHREADRIAELGCVISELPCSYQPRPQNFPIRNRIIAALARATVVVQASVRSGSLITARCALDLGREVLAVPGRIFDRRCRGSNALLRDGAHPALDARSVLEILPVEAREQLKCQREAIEAQLTGNARQGSLLSRELLDSLEQRSQHAEELARATTTPVGGVLATLLELEIEGHVRRLDGGKFTLRRT